jgi:asparagine synthase (glutamine-hydrolysing)
VCGICGIVNGGGESMNAAVYQMNSIQQLRGPDDRGISEVVTEGFCCTLGHTRLAIIDRAGGTQPMTHPETGVSLVFNGEIYNHPLLRSELGTAGCVFRTRSDTEVLLNGYHVWGLEGLLKRIDGMFAFALADPRERLLFLARDPAGQKPLYYANGTSSPDFAFASTLKALSTTPWFDHEIDRTALELFLDLRVIPAPYSIYRHARKLPPGSYLRFDGVTSLVKEYWSPFAVAVRTVPQSEGELEEEYRSLLGSSLAETLTADVPVSLLLSSGIDSASLACELSRLPQRDSVTAYTVGFADRGFDEAARAIAIARHLRLRHRVLDFGDLPLDEQLITLRNTVDEPFGDPSLLPTLALCRTVAANSRVAIGGDGADELFGGYPTFPLLRFWPLINRFPDTIRFLSRHVLPLLSSRGTGHSSEMKVERLALGLGEKDKQAFSSWLCIFPPNDSARLLGSGRDDLFREFVDRQIGPLPENDPINSMSRIYFRLFLPGVLEKMDRASMHYSLETRAPFLQRRMVEFALSLPAHFKVRNGRTKYIMRRSLTQQLPSQISNAAKMGFLPPLAGLFYGPQGEHLTASFPGTCDRFGMDRVRVESVLAEHRSGRRDHSQRLWLICQLGFFLANEDMALSDARVN